MEDLCQLFNTTYIAFLNTLDSLHLDIEFKLKNDDVFNIKNHINDVELASRFQKKTPSTLFLIYASPYSEYIFNKDETFFLNDTFSTSIRDTIQEEEPLVNTDDESFDAIISVLKTKWLSISDDDKNTIWSYLQSLLAISTKIN